ncbi:MAG: hypothetical protein AB1847_05340 [bacterium]
MPHDQTKPTLADLRHLDAWPHTVRQQVFQELMRLILKGDICTLLDHCEIPPLSKEQQRPLFAILSPRGQSEVRLQRDKLIRQCIDRLRELTIIFRRLNVSEKSEIHCCPASADSPCFSNASSAAVASFGYCGPFTTQVRIKISPSPLAATVYPELGRSNPKLDRVSTDTDRQWFLSFTLTITDAAGGWKITHLSQANFFTLPASDATP